jgi:nucleotide-binding universal stress UspA family protein
MMQLESDTLKTNYEKILVAIEPEAEGKDQLSDSKALAQAISLAKNNHSSLFIFHSVDSLQTREDVLVGINVAGLYAGETLTMTDQMLKEKTEALETWLQSLQEVAMRHGVQADYEYAVGEPGKLICQLAKEHGVDLIIVGRRGRRGMSEMLLGSVSNYVVHHAPCQVLVVQHE